MAVAFTDEDFRRFSEWLANQYGIEFGPEKRDMLRARLDARRAELGLSSFDQLYFHLKFDPGRELERDRLLTAVTNNESYFLRERRHLELLREEVLPVLRRRQRQGGAPVRILSAGCAAGEEPYSLAMVVQECGVVPPERVEILGVDLDTAALARAETALYREHSLRGVEDEVRGRYFRAEAEQWRLVPRIRERARFRRINLVERGWAEQLPPHDVIFCRNVLIYFGDAATRRVLDEFRRALKPGGFLFLGHSESLSRLATPFRPERRRGAVYYRLPEG